MLNFTTKTVREIALEMPITTKVFEEFKIDYCCGGQKMFLDACRNVGASPEAVLQKIDDCLFSDEKIEIEKLNDASASEVINYICDKHHVFTREEISNLTPLMRKVANRHGENHAELIELETSFYELADDLLQHLQKEEQILFPYIEDLEKTLTKQTAIPMSCFGTVENPIRMMMFEHDNAGEILRKMREITNDYKLPEGVCASYTALYNRLEGFEKDLHQHIHLENNLLFPKAIELEQAVFN
jgi:regulator of cell morphogenesis and NO signaling